MAIGFTDDQNYKDIGSAIRTKLGVNTLYAPDEMSAAILSIPTGGGSTLETKTVTPTETKTTYTPSSGYDGFSSFTVNAISDTYVGSNVTRRSSTDLSISGATVTAPIGYYDASASKTIPSGSTSTPATSITANPSISVNSTTGLITSTASATKSVTPSVSAGYITSGTSGTITVSGSNTSQLSTQSATTITPSKTSQTAVAAGKYTTGNVVVDAIPNEYIIPSGSLPINQNGTVDVTSYASVVVSVSSPGVNLETKTVTPSESEVTYTPSTGYDGFSSFTVSAISSTYVGSGINRESSADLSITITDTTVSSQKQKSVSILSPSGYYANNISIADSITEATFSSVTSLSFDSSGNATITFSPSSHGIVYEVEQYTITKSSAVTPRSSSDLTVSGATITAPAGYYSSSASASVSSMTLPTSASSSATSGYTSKATISRSTSNQYINIPTGYNSSGAYYLISATPNGSVTAPSTISGTSATVSTGTNTLTLSKSVSVTPNVTTAGYISSGTAGSSTVSLTASITTLGATTYNTSSSNQTISSGTYLTGTQTIRAVTTTNITAANIKSGITVQVGDSADADRVLSVTGTFSSDADATSSNIEDGYTAYVNGVKVTGDMIINKYYTGSSAPLSSLGSNGDIYLQS